MVGDGQPMRILIGFDFYQPNNVTANARAFIRSYYSQLNDQIAELGNGYRRTNKFSCAYVRKQLYEIISTSRYYSENLVNCQRYYCEVLFSCG